MLSPQQITSLQSANPPSGGAGVQNGQAMNDRQFKQWVGGNSSPSSSSPPQPTQMNPSPEAPGLMNGTNPIKSYVQGVGSDMMSAANSLTQDPTQGKGGVATPQQELSAGLDTAQKVTGAVLSPITRVISPILQPIVQKLGDTITSNPKAVDMLNQVNGMIDKHPQAAQDLGNLFPDCPECRWSYGWW